MATGLAWTEAAATSSTLRRTLLPDGKGLTLTGQLGEVMQESVKAAQSYIWSHACDFDIDPALFKNYGVHVHVPAGAIPKDGPSAGVTMATALTSLYTRLPARSDVAMTGEITLTGWCCRSAASRRRCWPRGGLESRRVIMPKANQKDLRDLPEEVRKEMQFIFAQRVEDVLQTAIPQLSERMSGTKTGLSFTQHNCGAECRQLSAGTRRETMFSALFLCPKAVVVDAPGSRIFQRARESHKEASSEQGTSVRPQAKNGRVRLGSHRIKVEEVEHALLVRRRHGEAP